MFYVKSSNKYNISAAPLFKKVFLSSFKKNSSMFNGYNSNKVDRFHF